MLQHEFEERYGKRVSALVYEFVNDMYMESELEKDEFVAWFKASGAMEECLEKALEAELVRHDEEMREVKRRLTLLKNIGRAIYNEAEWARDLCKVPDMNLRRNSCAEAASFIFSRAMEIAEA